MVARGVAIKRKAKVRRALPDPCQMQFQQCDSLFRIESHGLNQVIGGGGRLAHEISLDQALSPFRQAL